MIMVRKTTDTEKKQNPTLAEDVAEGQPDQDQVELSDREELIERLKKAEKKADENQEKYLRALADLDNYRKRSEKEKSDIRRFGNEDLIRDVVPLIDTLNRAIGHASGPNAIEAIISGLKLVQEQLVGCLKKHGVEEIEALGKEFDPHVHEAMLHTESGQHKLNEIIEEYEKGYLLHGRLLKPTRVAVCKGQGTGSDGSCNNDN